MMLNGQPLDVEHPGFKKLRLKDQDSFRRLKRGASMISSLDKDKLEKLARAIELKTGPYDARHVGFSNLIPDEQDNLEYLVGRSASRQNPLDRGERRELARLKELMRPAIPYDNIHPGFDYLGSVD